MEAPPGAAAGAVVAGTGSQPLGNAATAATTTRNGAVVATVANGQGRLLVAGQKRRHAAMNDAAGGSRSQDGTGQWQWQVSPLTLLHPQNVPLQRLVNACRNLLHASTVPPTDGAVATISSLMDKIGMLDVHLMEEISFSYANNLGGRQNPPVVTCKTIYKCANNSFMVSVLYLPRGAAMPLHDHPMGMTLFTKLLVGSARVETYNWVRPRVSAAGPSSAGSTAVMLAEKMSEDDHTGRGARTWVLGGDMTRFVNGWDGPCAFLRVFTPLAVVPTAEHRRCFFYRDSPYKFDLNVAANAVTEERQRRLVWVQKVEYPQDVIKLVNLPYVGPPIL